MNEPLYRSETYWKEIHALAEDLGNKLTGSSRVEARIMGLEVLPRLTVCVRHLGKECSECVNYSAELQEWIERLPEIADPANKQLQQDFQKTTDRVMNHLKQHHQMQPKGKVFSRIVLLGMLIGVLMGLILFLFQSGKSVFGFLATGWLLGMMGGYISGKVLEFRMLKKNQLF